MPLHQTRHLVQRQDARGFGLCGAGMQSGESTAGSSRLAPASNTHPGEQDVGTRRLPYRSTVTILGSRLQIAFTPAALRSVRSKVMDHAHETKTDDADADH
jgi:hypothetical protein